MINACIRLYIEWQSLYYSLSIVLDLIAKIQIPWSIIVQKIFLPSREQENQLLDQVTNNKSEQAITYLLIIDDNLSSFLSNEFILTQCYAIPHPRSFAQLP